MLEDINLQGARGILVNVTSNGDLGLNEFDEIGSIMHAFASDEADIKIGMAVNPNMGNEIKLPAWVIKPEPIHLLIWSKK